MRYCDRFGDSVRQVILINFVDDKIIVVEFLEVRIGS